MKTSFTCSRNVVVCLIATIILAACGKEANSPDPIPEPASQAQQRSLYAPIIITEGHYMDPNNLRIVYMLLDKNCERIGKWETVRTVGGTFPPINYTGFVSQTSCEATDASGNAFTFTYGETVTIQPLDDLGSYYDELVIEFGTQFDPTSGPGQTPIWTLDPSLPSNQWSATWQDNSCCPANSEPGYWEFSSYHPLEHCEPNATW